MIGHTASLLNIYIVIIGTCQRKSQVVCFEKDSCRYAEDFIRLSIVAPLPIMARNVNRKRRLLFANRQRLYLFKLPEKWHRTGYDIQSRGYP